MASSSSSRPSSRASLSAWAADWAMGWPSSSLKADTSSRQQRLALGAARWRAAGQARCRRPLPPPIRFRRGRPAAPAAAAGWACRPTARRKASRSARTERRVGSRISTSASASGSPPCCGQHARRQLVGEAPVDADGEHAFHRQHAFGVGEGLRACRYGTSRRHETRRTAGPPPRRGSRAGAARSGPSGESRNRRASQTDTLAKT